MPKALETKLNLSRPDSDKESASNFGHIP